MINVNEQDKKDIKRFIKNNQIPQLLRKLKKIGGFSEETGILKIDANHTRFLVSNKLRNPKGEHSQRLDKMEAVFKSILGKINP